MAKNHLKRINSPRTWDVLRKSSEFITRPNPGCLHEESIPLNTLLKEMLCVARITKDVKKALTEGLIFVDGRIRKDYKYPAGFMSVVSIPKEGKHFRILINTSAKLYAKQIDNKEANLKLLKIVDKTLLKKGKLQFNFRDGTNMLIDKSEKTNSYKTNDVLLVEIPKLAVKKHLKLEKGSTILLVKGKHAGAIGTVKEISGKKIIFTEYKKDANEAETKLEYAFVIGNPEPELDI
ncbi:MAG: 30S ribosomal protein S4e [Candidatus Woesearchaeota archaeon]